MPLPTPEPGLVVHYGYLWRHEHERGRDTARYARPCAIVTAVRRTVGGELNVVVAPLTHRRPDPDRNAVEIPVGVRRALQLPQRTWAIVDEVNAFVWPGFDLEVNDDGVFEWGQIPAALHNQISGGVLTAARAGRLRLTPR